MNLRRRGFTLIELMIVVAIIGILAALAIPNFIRFQARSKQGEAKANLKSLFTAQRSFFQEKDRYSEDITEIGFSPERGNRYQYLGSETLDYEDRTTVNVTRATGNNSITVDIFKHTTAVSNPEVATGTIAYATEGGGADPLEPGVSTGCPDCNFAAFAAGNIDNETTGTDSWFIASKDATVTAVCGESDTAAPAGAPFNMYNDVSCDTAP